MISMFFDNSFNAEQFYIEHKVYQLIFWWWTQTLSTFMIHEAVAKVTAIASFTNYLLLLQFRTFYASHVKPVFIVSLQETLPHATPHKATRQQGL